MLHPRKWLMILLFSFTAIITFATNRFVNFTGEGFLLGKGNNITIAIDDNDESGAKIAANNLCTDFERVTGMKAVIAPASESDIIIGTLGHSQTIDECAKRGIINAADLKGRNEKYIITTSGHQLVIAGSNQRGTIYGIYELSRQIGVSPWYYWADVAIAHHNNIYIIPGTYTDGEPSVRYRGIFLNDEAPCLTSWVKNTFQTNYGGHAFYEKVFELILRLKGNMLWPAMWGWAFYADDTENSALANKMGVIIGTSHHEPMARNHQEWARNRKSFGAWNYKTNQATLDRFFQEGIRRMKGTEDIVTIGMRGDGDEAMDSTADVKLLERIIANQRNIIARETGKPASRTPQVWALYKEVLDYYDKGMKVPDDVTLLLCDDNWGNVRRVPTPKERNRKGGWGLYYHVDYVGAPRNSKWLNSTSSQHMWEQLTLAYQYGIDRMWMLNVGDLKPMEYPIDLFMSMAWDAKKYNAANLLDHTRAFCTSAFGSEQAEEAARILNLQGQYAGRCTAELLDAETYNLASGEWAEVVSQYNQLEADALRQFLTLKEQHRDTYQELILFPVQAMANLYRMYYAQAMNHQLFKDNNPDCNLWADKALKAFELDSLLCQQYNTDIAGGKWNGMMTQKHIGYTSWNDNFPHNMHPKLYRLNDSMPGGYVFTDSTRCVVMEAEHYWRAQSSSATKWIHINNIGRTRGGMVLQPYDASISGAQLQYRFHAPALTEGRDKTVRVHVITRSTLDFLNKGGLTYRVSIDNGDPVLVNFNKDLNEKPANIYTVYYPTIARRVVERVATLPIAPTANGWHTLTIIPCDPAIVFEKFVIENGDYPPQYLFGKESKCVKDETFNKP